jgi:hypothetical protein
MSLEPGPVFAPSQLQWTMSCRSNCAKNVVVGSHIYEFFIAANKIEATGAYFHDVSEIQENSCSKTNL